MANEAGHLLEKKLKVRPAIMVSCFLLDNTLHTCRDTDVYQQNPVLQASFEGRQDVSLATNEVRALGEAVNCLKAVAGLE